jgi:hypothetical protein
MGGRAVNTCAICGKHITRNFLVCRSCETTYELRGPIHLWPEWAVCLVNEHSRERYTEKLERKYLVGPYSDEYDREPTDAPDYERDGSFADEWWIHTHGLDLAH